MKEYCGHIGNCSLVTAIDAFSAVQSHYNWLIVAIDSSRGKNLARVEKTVSGLLRNRSAKFWWTDAGLWLEGQEIVKAVDWGVIVAFSAMYIFDNTIRSCPVPTYSHTSDAGEFGPKVPEELRISMELIQAEGFIADGVGLNYYLKNEKLGHILETL